MYDEFADSFAVHAEDSPYNAHYDRPAVLDLIGDVRGQRILDAGCGPGLVAETFLAAEGGYRVLGCDLSGEMVERARARCTRFGDRAEFLRASVRGCADELVAGRREPVGGAVSRLVLHHAPDPRAFAEAMVGQIAAAVK